VARSGESVRSWTLGQEVRFLPTSGENGDVLRVEVAQAAGLGVPVHVHPAQEERFHVAEGQISLRIGRRRLKLSAGQSAIVPRGSAHSFRARSRGGARLVNEFRPALRTDECFGRTFEVERMQPLARRLRELGLIAEAYPREFLLYAPGIPWQIQRAAMQQLARIRLGNGGVKSDGPLANRWLAIYMNDQLAAGVLWREVARRVARENAGEEAGAPLGELADGIAEDVALFRRMMRELGIQERRVKIAGAVAAERLGRAKLNGRLLRRSPLSRFAELDFLAMGIEGKKILWSNLRDLAGLGGRFPDVDFDALLDRAAAQRALIEPLRDRAGRAVLPPG
jgi:quercetin dioxygenase-like cupin family protein